MEAGQTEQIDLFHHSGKNAQFSKPAFALQMIFSVYYLSFCFLELSTGSKQAKMQTLSMIGILINRCNPVRLAEHPGCVLLI